MKVENVTIFAGNTEPSSVSGAGWNRKTLYAGDFLEKLDPMEQKKKQAKEQAMKIVGDAWDNDRLLQKQLDDKRDQIQEYRSIIRESKGELDRIEQQRSDLRSVYGVSEDSQEEKDLRLLEKWSDQSKPWAKTELTEEESKRLQEIQEAGLTQYQKDSMVLYRGRSRYEKEIYFSQNALEAENVALATMKVDMVKNQGMLKAQDAKEQILAAESDEVLGMLIQKGQEHIDEKMEEEQEAAKEKAEKEELEEERIEERKQKETVQKVLDEWKLLDEDLKGAAVDAIS